MTDRTIKIALQASDIHHSGLQVVGVDEKSSVFQYLIHVFIIRCVCLKRNLFGTGRNYFATGFIWPAPEATWLGLGCVVVWRVVGVSIVSGLVSDNTLGPGCVLMASRVLLVPPATIDVVMLLFDPYTNYRLIVVDAQHLSRSTS